MLFSRLYHKQTYAAMIFAKRYHIEQIPTPPNRMASV